MLISTGSHQSINSAILNRVVPYLAYSVYIEAVTPNVIAHLSSMTLCHPHLKASVPVLVAQFPLAVKNTSLIRSILNLPSVEMEELIFVYIYICDVGITLLKEIRIHMAVYVNVEQSQFNYDRHRVAVGHSPPPILPALSVSN